MALPADLPVFPLPGALLLPRARLPLHIFEPRYIRMVEAALKSPARMIGMIQPLAAPPQAAQGEGRSLARIGCAGRISGFSELEDGRYLITLTGRSRFRLGAEIEPGQTPFRRFEVDFGAFPQDQGPGETDPGLNRAALFATLQRFVQDRGIAAEVLDLRSAEDESLINALSMILPFDVGDKQALLEAPSLSTRRETLTSLMEFALLNICGGPGSEVRQ